MAKYIPTGESTTFQVQLKGIKEGTETAQFQIWAKTGSSTEVLDELEGEVQGGTASLTWTAKGPPEDGEKREWRVQYKVTVPGRNEEDIEKTSEELIVYNNWLDISSVLAEDGSALPDAPYEIKIGKSEPITGNTGESGTFKEEALPPGEIKSFKWLKWAKLEAWEEQQGVSHKAKLSVCKTAKIISPELERKKGVRKLKQWTNLAADPEKPEQGNKLTIKVELEEGKAGDKVYLKTTFDDKTKRDDVERAVEGGLTDSWCEGGGKIAELPGDGEPVEFVIELGYEGGSQVKIEIGGNENCGDDILMVTNWRKLHYQLAHPSDMKKPSVSRAKKALAAAFIDLERLGRPTKLSARATSDAPTGSWYPGSDHGSKTRRQFLNVSAGNRSWWHDKAFPDGQKTRTTVNVLLCHTNFETEKAECDHSGRTDPFDMTMLREIGQIEWKGQQVWGMPLAGPDGFYALATSLKDGQPAFKSASWKEQGGDAREGTFAAEDVEFRNGEALARFPADCLTVLEEGKQITVEYEIFLAEGPFLGDAGSEDGYKLTIAAAAGEMGSPTHNTTLCDVLAHEIGHALAQVANAPPPGLSDSDHGRRYTDNEHYGSHCADGMSDAEYGGGSGGGEYAGDFRNASQCECVMYGQNKASQSTANGKFCHRCAMFLRAEKLDAIT